MVKTLGIKNNFLAIEDEFSNYENSKVAILPVPYEATTSYGKGTGSAPEAIYKASHYVEFYDEELHREFCFEKGIASLPPMNLKNLKGRDALDVIYGNVKKLIDDGKFVVTLGGEHTISTAPIKAHFDSYKNLSVLHFDAHSDLRDKYEGTKYSHACFCSRVAEFTKDITQVGIRAQCIEESRFIKKNGIRTFYAYAIRNNLHTKNWMDKVISGLKENVYVTFDIDYFDPSVISATGTPEPLGFYWEETMHLLKKLGRSRNVVGFDLVELAPVKGFTYPDFLAAKLVYKMLNYFIK